MRRYIILLLAALLAFSSCFKDDRNNFLPEESFYLLTAGYSEVKIDKECIELTIIKTGKGLSEANVSVVIDEQALAQYNAEFGDKFVSLPENVLEFGQTSLHFSKNDFRKKVNITWSSAAVSALMKLQDYVIPISISSNELKVVDGKGFIIIKPVE